MLVWLTVIDILDRLQKLENNKNNDKNNDKKMASLGVYKLFIVE